MSIIEYLSERSEVLLFLKLCTNFILGFIIFGLLISISALVINEIFGWYSIESSNTIASAMGAAGTLLLAWFTFKTINQNEKLVKQQQKQIEQQQIKSRPILHQIGDFRSGEEKDSLYITLKNVGEGDAHNIGFRTDLCIPELGINTADESYSSNNIDHNIPKLTAEDSFVYKHDMVNVEEDKVPLGILESGAVSEFDFRISFENKDNTFVDKLLDNDRNDDHPPRIVITKLLQIMKNEGVDKAIFQITMNYEDIYENEYTKVLSPWVADIANVDDIDDLIDSPMLVDYTEDSVGRVSLSNLRI